MATSLKVLDAVVIPWGISEVRGKVAEIYASGRGRQWSVRFSPRTAATSLTSRPPYALPIGLVRPAGAA